MWEYLVQEQLGAGHEIHKRPLPEMRRSANGKPYLPHLDSATPEYDVSQVIPIDVFKAHVIAMKLFLTR